MDNFNVFEMEIAGRTLRVETGKVAQLCNGSAMIRYGDTVVLTTATASAEAKEGQDFFPLTCDYEEKMYAAGKIPGGFIKREGKASEKATLSARLMDRPIRPLFPKGYFNDVHVVATIMSADFDCPSEIVAMIGSSVALSISDIPFEGPTGTVLMGKIGDEFIVNPTLEQREQSDLHLVVSGTKEAIMMVEAGANEISEDDMLEAIMRAHEEIKKIIAFIEDIQAKVGKEKKEPNLHVVSEELEAEVLAYATDKMKDAIYTEDKVERQENMDKVEKETMEYFGEKYPDDLKDVDSVLYKLKKEMVRSRILNEGVRPDNRKTTEIRPIWCETSVLPKAHGTGLFTRGQTQVLTVATLGMLSESQTLDGITEATEKRYIHHYNFPGYSVGETRPMRGPGRREIGHGALAERALLPVIPDKDEFPYTIRLVSEVLSSNGSTSQASVCGSTLALMDAGVPIKAPVAGIAMGLIKSEDKVAILSDIQGMEDFLGDMDFKVAGTAKGITAIQMDIKIHGIDREILKTAIAQAREGRMFIMDKMLDVLERPRPEVNPNAPRIEIIKVHPDKIREIIGPGGKVINGIIDKTGVKIDIEDDGTVYVSGKDKATIEAGLSEINMIVKEPEVGEVYDGVVTRLMAFGAFVQILPNKEGLLHISKISHERVAKVEDALKVGDHIQVKVMEIDSQNRINLSHKDLIPKRKQENSKQENSKKEN
ncbi:MAG: polyribonucleotide nucleotidyltransferase [Firmicutes bacterium]|nr:polyribonucleotide nucleotidyltransferase [Bacillota bacterium]